MAIISLVAGILGLTLVPFLGSVVALIVGYMAKNEIKASNGAIGGDGLATAGLILSFIGIALGLVLCCFGVVTIGIPFCLAAFAVSLEEYNQLLPLMVSML
jgi:hypothetical protein